MYPIAERVSVSELDDDQVQRLLGYVDAMLLGITRGTPATEDDVATEQDTQGMHNLFRTSLCLCKSRG